MLEKNLQSLNEVIIGSARPDVAKLLQCLKREGRVKRLAPRIYTTNLTDSAENIIRRNSVYSASGCANVEGCFGSGRRGAVRQLTD